MDGNGRWAKQRRLPVAAGHRAGARRSAASSGRRDPGVQDLDDFRVLHRELVAPARGGRRLMHIFVELIEREVPELAEEGVRVRFIGRRDRAPEELQRRMAGMEDRTELNSRLNLWVAFDYGGRAELVEAARRIVESGVDPGGGSTRTCSRPNLYAPDLPDLGPADPHVR